MRKYVVKNSGNISFFDIRFYRLIILFVFILTSFSDSYAQDFAGINISALFKNPVVVGHFVILIFVIFILMRVLSVRRKLIKQLNYEHRELSHRKDLDHLKSEFYTDITHDLRTPLTLIIGPIEKWLRLIKNVDLKNDLTMIQKNSNRMLSLINQLFDLSRIDSGELELKLQPVNIVDILRELVFSFSSMAKQEQINLSFTSSHDAIILNIDRGKFGNIITNLLDNAFKHTPVNGKIAVSAFIRPPEEDTGSLAQYADIIVRDTGEGIPREHVEKIFDRFYQVKEEYKNTNVGSGLGLSVVRELTELHHGTVKVDSKVNRGSAFTLSFPLEEIRTEIKLIDTLSRMPLNPVVSIQPGIEDTMPVNAALDTEVPESGLPKPENAAKLLIVEDNSDMRTFLRKCLQERYEIYEAVNGIEGLEMTGKLDPDLIISDVIMPEMDGYELCRRIKTNELTSHIPVILLTARASIEDKIGGFEVGADDYIFKPFDSLELTTRVKNLIVQRRKLWERFHEEIIVQPGRVTVTPADHLFLQKVMAIVEECIADPHLETQILADKVGMSRMNLHRKIKAITGQTPGQFISTMRLKRAAQLIKEHAGNVTEVAYDVGFNSLSYFARCFKSEFGILPSEFAKHNPYQG